MTYSWQKTCEFEQQMTEMKEKLAKAEMALNEALETVKSVKEKEQSMKARLEKIQQEWDTHRISTVREISSLKVGRRVYYMEFTL